MANVPIALDTGGRNLGDFEERLTLAVNGFADRLSIAPDKMDTIRVVVTYSRSEFDKATLDAVPDWGIGAALPEESRVVLLFSESSRSPEAAELVVHELGHIFLHKAVGDIRLPRWFDEGFAQWVSGRMDFGQAVQLSWANLLGETIPLRGLETMNSWNAEEAKLAYAESYAAFLYLIELMPDGRPNTLIRGIGEAGDFEVGFQAATGLSLNEFYILWARERGNRYNWPLLLADWRVSFSIITFLFLILGGIKLIGIHRAKKKAEDEEIQAYY